jgi:hypothetical protein
MAFSFGLFMIDDELLIFLIILFVVHLISVIFIYLLKLIIFFIIQSFFAEVKLKLNVFFNSKIFKLIYVIFKVTLFDYLIH